MTRSLGLGGFCIAAIMMGTTAGATAGSYSDEMAKCLVESSTTEEKGALIKWMFAIAALHPAISPTSTVTDAQRTEFNKTTAALFESLVTERCRKQVADAVKYEGSGTLQTAFGVLGQAAMMELFSDAQVAKGLQEYVVYLDKAKLEQILGPGGAVP